MNRDREPLIRALAAAAVIAGAIVAAINGMADVPDWVTRYVLPIAGIVAAVGGGGAVARQQVWAPASVREAVDEAIAAAPVDLPVDDEPVDLDEAAKAAGLD